jgi:hypothetical protein
VLVDTRVLRAEAADADPREIARILNDVDAAVFLQRVGQLATRRTIDRFLADHLDTLRRLFELGVDATTGDDHRIERYGLIGEHPETAMAMVEKRNTVFL